MSADPDALEPAWAVCLTCGDDFECDPWPARASDTCPACDQAAAEED